MKKICFTRWTVISFVLLLSSAFFAACGDDNNDPGTPSETDPEISLNKEELVLEIGASERLVASFNPPETPNKAHVWSSSAADIVSVDETGMVTALAIGEATITAKALAGGKTASCHVTVASEVVHVTNISLNYKEETITVGEQLQLRATVSPSNATNKTVKWMSSDEAVATVNSNGLVSAVSKGAVVITASSNDGNKTASCQLKVKAETPEITGTNFTPTDVYVDKLMLVSPVQDGVEEVDVCFGTTPSPTVTSGSVTKSEIGTDGLLHLTLEGLKSGTTYYIRSYNRTGASITYNDDEVAVQTFGGDIQMKDEFMRREKYEDPLGFEHYYVYLKINYKIEGQGTYLVESEGKYASAWTLLAKEDSYSSELYVEGGEGSFNCRRDGGVVEYEGISKYLQFQTDDSLVFTNLETSVRYHSPALRSKFYF